MNWIKEVKQEIRGIKSSERDLKKFGILIGSIFLFLAVVSFWNRWFSDDVLYGFFICSIILIIFGIFVPKKLKSVYLAWMSIAIVIGNLVSRVILFILFFVILTPISILARIFGKNFFVKFNDKKMKSYWIKRNADIKINYERMY